MVAKGAFSCHIHGPFGEHGYFIGERELTTRTGRDPVAERRDSDGVSARGRCVGIGTAVNLSVKLSSDLLVIFGVCTGGAVGLDMSFEMP